ncbi:MAG: YbaB/EbfC family nucleoid-associated protein [Alphaproteobacteria bacterium]|nr:YbaB/EbfC family nucleoid-associated protein [Alphaproteobacteria bacterium]
MDMEALMAQAAELQNKVASAQEQLGKTKVKGVSENGSCIIDMTGKYDVLNIKIHPTVLAHGADVVAQVVLSAYHDAKQKADELIDKVMGEATAGVPMPQ